MLSQAPVTGIPAVGARICNPPALLANWLQIWGLSRPLQVLELTREMHRIRESIYTRDYNFSIKDTNWDQLREEMHRMKAERVPN